MNQARFVAPSRGAICHARREGLSLIGAEQPVTLPPMRILAWLLIGFCIAFVVALSVASAGDVDAQTNFGRRCAAKNFIRP